MAKNVLIVESPAKAKTIEKYLGKDFIVKSSYGHIRDLDKGKNGIDVADNFKASYVVSPEKKKVVADLKKEVKKAEEVWLATDEDREGEAISWHLCEVLGLDPASTKRIVFHEITESAIKNAVKNPRTVDIDLVNAQQARRILDRLVGFELSEILWRKIKGKLSAGRVQSVAVKLIVERENEIRDFETVGYYKVVAEFNLEGTNGGQVIMQADLSSRLDTLQQAKDFLGGCKGAIYKVQDIQVKPGSRKPAAPFTTSTLQQEASRKLGFSVSRTMSTAQRLYEQGLITYMRTDSINLSELAISNMKEEITKRYGKEYLESRRYKTKKANAQEAHEAIRPTYFDRDEAGKDSDQRKLYDLIWKRTIASQMSNAKLEKTTVRINISTQSEHNLKATGEVLIFDGFLKVYMESKDDDNAGDESKGILPPLTVGQLLDLNNMMATERFTRPPSRYSEAMLVKKLEELGIGRPSTYAPTITKITEKARGYVVKESREGKERNYQIVSLKNDTVVQSQQTEMTGATSNRLYGTDMGRIVTEFLEKHFDDVMRYNFTADIENKFDVISEGNLSWKQMIKDFYDPFHATVVETIENADRASGERILGKDPASGRTLLVRMSRFGPVAQIGNAEELAEDEKPKYASLQRGQSLETVTVEEALELFKLPRMVGQLDGKDMEINIGRFGPYIKHDEKFISIPRGEDPFSMEFDRATEIVRAKQKEDEPLGHYNDKPYTQGKGRFGPFIKWNGMFINIPRRYDPENLSEKDTHELIQAKIEKEANRYIHQWPEEGISVQNGRWGPFIKIAKKSIQLPKKDNVRMTTEEAKELTFDQVIKLIEDFDPTLLKKKKTKAASASKRKPKTTKSKK
ncbi:UNVERIFIED_CONTAM: hypothetical protein GTU68_002464 [Idotea baltica]|nr:hypothetical protein [Idotea baltica]